MCTVSYITRIVFIEKSCHVDYLLCSLSHCLYFYINSLLSISLQNVYAPEEDPEMKVERYTRTDKQNDMLGLNDLKTDNY